MGNNSNRTHIEISWDQPTIVQSGYTNLTAIIVKVQILKNEYYAGEYLPSSLKREYNVNLKCPQ